MPLSPPKNDSSNVSYAALLAACEHGRIPEIAGLLAEHPHLLREGGEGNDSQGLTPLICAVQWAQTETVEWLLARGADTALRDRQGRTASDWADAIPYPSIGTLIREEEERRARTAQLKENSRQITEFAAQFTEGLENPVKVSVKPLKLKNRNR